MRTHTGGCHCGRVRFEVDAPAELCVTSCNCSVCTRTGFLHLVVPADRFRLLAGDEFLKSYRFNTGTANHLFCSVCGIKSFYVPRSHPDGISVNARCVDRDTVVSLIVEQEFDGQNWEQHVHELAPLGD
ncbi:MAG: GFA family protein [Gammaproteobacteria bacterium]|nr:GFA family protein [Gammaproteobacteria bacterium]